jgi:hypothetical protein
MSGSFESHTTRSDIIDIIPSTDSKTLKISTSLWTLQFSAPKEPVTMDLFVDWETETINEMQSSSNSFLLNGSSQRRRTVHFDFLKSVTISLDELMTQSPSLQHHGIFLPSIVIVQLLSHSLNFFENVGWDPNHDLIAFSSNASTDVVEILDRIFSSQYRYQKIETAEVRVKPHFLLFNTSKFIFVAELQLL